MYPYFVMFIISLFFVSVGEKCADVDRAMKNVLEFIGLAIPIVFAAVRTEGVGVDMTGYGKWIIEKARFANDYHSYYAVVTDTGWKVDPAFAAIGYICNKLSSNPYFFYGVIEALILLPVWCAIKEVSEERNSWIPLAIYYVIFYLQGLNLMRQEIAISFVALAIAKLFKEKYASFVVAIAIGWGFHKTAIVGILLLPAFILSGRLYGEKSKLKQLYFVVLMIMFVLGFVYLTTAKSIPIISNASMFEENYERYLVGKYDQAGYLSFYLFYGLVALSIIAMSIQEKTEYTPQFVGLLISLGLSFLFRLMGKISAPTGRLAFYFLVAIPIILSYICKDKSVPIKIKSSLVALFATSFMAFYYFYIVNNLNGTIPYATSLF